MEQELLERWRGSNNNSMDQRELTAIAQRFAELQSDGYKLYSITTTYKPTKFDHKPSLVKEYFKAIYFHELLPKHLFQDKKWIYTSKDKQPYTYGFLELHQEKPNSITSTKDGVIEATFLKRYHHHALMAVLPEHVDAMDRLVGIDTLVQIHASIKTSKIDHADTKWISYAGKNYHEFRDEMLIYAPPKSALKPVETVQAAP